MKHTAFVLAGRRGRIGLIALLIAAQSSDAQIRVKIPLPIPVIKKVIDNASRGGNGGSDEKRARSEKKASRSVASDTRASAAKQRSTSRAIEGRAPYPTGQASDFYGAGGPRIPMVSGRSLAYSYASQGYFNRAKVCVAHGDGTTQDIVEDKALYAKSSELKLSPVGKWLLEDRKIVPRRDITCPECNGTGRGYYTGDCWKCGGRGTVKESRGWNSILGLD